jgi:hypothetical protein
MLIQVHRKSSEKAMGQHDDSRRDDRMASGSLGDSQEKPERGETRLTDLPEWHSPVSRMHVK